MYLLDTNVLSELRKAPSGRAAPGVVAWAGAQDAETLFISVISLFEIELGILQIARRDPVQGEILRRWQQEHLRPAFVARILPVTDAIASRAADLHIPDPAPLADSLLAATALVHGLTVVTRNTVDFRFSGVPVLDPWGSTHSPA